MGVHNRPRGDGRHGGSRPPMPGLRRGIPAPATGDVQTARNRVIMHLVFRVRVCPRAVGVSPAARGIVPRCTRLDWDHFLRRL
eukprot:2111134-Prymnesium_polylepis.1